MIYTEPVTGAEAAVSAGALSEEGFAMSFASKILELELDEPMLAPLIARAAQIHALGSPPAARAGCGDCGYFEKIRALLG